MLEDSLKDFMELTSQTINEVKNATFVNTQSIGEVKNATMVNTQAIAKMEVQMVKSQIMWAREKKESSPASPCQTRSCSSMGEVHQMLCKGKSMVQPLSHLSQ